MHVIEKSEHLKANIALIKILAKRLQIPRSAISVVKGHKFRDRTLKIDGLQINQLV